MLQSRLFPKTQRETPKDADNISTALLTRGGFIHKLMAGSYTFEPLGWRVMRKIEQIIREEMDAVGGQEIVMPVLHPKELWDRSGRWVKLVGDMYQFKDPSERELGLAMTHEETFIDLLGAQPLSYQDLPLALYQFQLKFRHEPRAKSGLLRAREFIMKDMYSADVSEAAFKKHYELIKAAYGRIFKRLELPVVVTVASGGIFTADFSHEFQTLSAIGEDTVYVCPELDYGVNAEVIERTGRKCPVHDQALEPQRAVEVGNIFPLGTQFSEKMNVLFTDESGAQKAFWGGCYGIGLGRVMGVIVEEHHDREGIIWPSSIAPFAVHLIDLTKTADEKVQSRLVYERLMKAGIEVLFDDRDVAAGVKFTDADLLGLPLRVVVSSKTLEQSSIELKGRTSQNVKLVSTARIVEMIDGY